MTKRIALISVYSDDRLSRAMYITMLYQLLEQRKPIESISHKKMPSATEHCDFVMSKPYKQWYMIQSLDETNYPIVGAIYLGKEDNIGIGIFDVFKRQHYATAAIKALMDFHPQEIYYANINPDNLKSKELFKRSGFKYHDCLKINNKIIQETYMFTRADA